MLAKRIAAFLIIVSFITQSFSRYLLAADYYLHTAAYIENCVNKNKPWMHCNGKCHLRKKMQQQENQDKQNTERQSGNNNQPISSKSSFPLNGQLLCTTGITIRRLNLSSGKAIRMPKFIFHPPWRQLC